MRVFTYAQDPGNDPVSYDLTIYYYDDVVAKQIIASNAISGMYGTDILTGSNAELVSFFTPKIIAHAATLGYTISATDIMWQTPSVISPQELAALQTAMAARSFSTPSFASATTATQLSATRDAQVQYGFDASVNISLLAGQSVTATLKYADNVGMTTNVVTVDAQATSNSGVLGLTQVNTLKVSGIIPKGKYRQVTFAVTGGASAPAAIKSSQEVLI